MRIIHLGSALAVALISSCASSVDLELSEVARFSVKERLENGRTFLKISGLPLHSAYVVDEVLTKEDDHSIELRIKLSKAEKNKSGSFDYDLAVPERINVVYLGSGKSEIWRRGK